MSTRLTEEVTAKHCPEETVLTELEKGKIQAGEGL
jgi:hypothetical protein